MQVLLMLVDAQGSVVTREDLLRQCWKGQIVGNDSVNRAIGEVRRIGRAVAGGFELETIPRIGYRLNGNALGAAQVAEAPTPRAAISRRLLVAGGLALPATGALALWSIVRSRPDPRARELVEQARAGLRLGTRNAYVQAVQSLRHAVALVPDDAAAWGWLAVALHREEISGHDEQSEEAAERAARRALAIDPDEANAQTVLALQRAPFEDWITAEDRMREIVSRAPDNIEALNYLILFYQGVGRCRDSLILSDRAVILEPLSPQIQFRHALKHWIFGRVGEADRTIDRALQLWPQHSLVWNTRLMIYAFTGRTRAGLAMVDDEASRPAELSPVSVAWWRIALRALETRAAADVDAARTASLGAAPHAAGLAANSVMTLSLLGQVDAAFAVAEGLVLRRGTVVGPPDRASGRVLYDSAGWRRTQWLFTPATTAVRADPRFRAFSRDIGLAGYWQQRGIGPDDFVRGAA